MVSKLNIEKVNHEVNRKLCLYISSGCLIAVMVLQIVGVFMRTLFNRPIWGLLDVCQILLAWLVFAAFAYALINSYHIRATLVVSRLSPRLRSACEIFGSVIGIGFFCRFYISRLLEFLGVFPGKGDSRVGGFYTDLAG